MCTELILGGKSHLSPEWIAFCIDNADSQASIFQYFPEHLTPISKHTYL